MGKIVVNKNFQSKYLYRAFERLVKPDYDIVNFCVVWWSGTTPNYGLANFHFQSYIDLSSVYKSNWSGLDYTSDPVGAGKTYPVPHQYFLCDETFLTLLNKINKTAKSGMSAFPKTPNTRLAGGAITESSKTANLNIMIFTATLFSPKKQVRDNAIDYFVLSNFITAEEGEKIKGIYSTFNLVDNNYTLNNLGVTYVPKTSDISSTYSNNILDMTFNKVLRLDNPYKQSTENVSNTTLYILVIPYSDTKFVDGAYKTLYWNSDVADLNATTYPNNIDNYLPESSIGMTLTGYQTFHNKANNTVVPQIPYIALSLTEVGAGGDIEYDHLDEIEYLDEIKITINLPKEYK